MPDSVGGVSDMNVIDVKPVQSINVAPTNSVTLDGISTDVRLEQPLNAPFPITVTVFGIVTVFNSVQSVKHWLFILVVPFGMSIEVIDLSIIDFINVSLSPGVEEICPILVG